MPMVRTLTKNKQRASVRAAPGRTAPRISKPANSPFPEYIEYKDGLYRCLLCKSRTLEKYMWLNRSGMYQHEKRGTRHKRSVKEWLEDGAKGVQLDTDESEEEEDEDSNLDELEPSELDEEQSECEDSVEVEEPEPEPIVEEPKTPTLYYPTTSWDEPVNQGVRVEFDNLQPVDCEPQLQEPRPQEPQPQEPQLQETVNIPEVKEKVVKWDGTFQACVYGSTKTNGYYTCIWCNLPDMPQRKYRRCKRAMKALHEKPTQTMENSPELEDLDPPPYQLLYPSY
ncbi:unnamed protein product [Rhizoctonia solani]|uniref:Uncharacterized protein n=1 Tax=Rhizoctonia solani TaxID=456999 RepID=A0A8H3DFV8_9AGAM|nr:unnamed protein product [Rhizoctonia solani]